MKAKIVVVGFDFSPLSELALREAVRVIRAHREDTIHIVTVLEELHGEPVLLADNAERATEARIQASLKKALKEANMILPVTMFAHVRRGDPVGEILSVSEDVEADLVIVGTHGRQGVKRLVMGSVAEKVMRHAGCPVLVMRPRKWDLNPELAPEPPCAECLKARSESGGTVWWCEAHAGRPWVPPHRYSYRDGTLHPFHADGIGPE